MQCLDKWLFDERRLELLNRLSILHPNNTSHASRKICAPWEVSFLWVAQLFKQPYFKPALTTDEQIAQLRKRGMIIQNDQTARHYLII